MPLVKRAVEPVFVSRATLSSKVKNELEGVVVNTLARLIKQLSSVSKHAETLFGDLVNEANGIYLRTVALSGRVQGLQDRIVTLDSGGKEDKRIEDFNVKVFKSSDKEEQQILDRGTLPTALQEVYRSCSAPPALNQLTPYRDDNKDGLKFYTDPSYFFVLWVKEQTKQIEKRQKKKAKGDLKKKESKKHEVKPVERKNYPGVDKEFMEHTLTKDVPGDIIPGTPPTNRASKESYAQDHPPSGPPPPQPLSQAQLAAPTAPPPPPPPPPNPGFAPAPPPPPIQMEGGPPMGNYPSNYSPPPVPPAPGNFSAPPPPAPSAGPPPPPPPTMPSEPGVVGEIKRPPPEVDQRSPLLLAIEKGMHLRKVEKKETKPSSTYATDVASILKRRIAFEVSDAESEEEDSDWLN